MFSDNLHVYHSLFDVVQISLYLQCAPSAATLRRLGAEAYIVCISGQGCHFVEFIHQRIASPRSQASNPVH
jgi:hypothetical protein